MAAVRRGPADIVDRARSGADEAAELLRDRVGRTPRAFPSHLVEDAHGESLRVDGSDDRRPAGSEPDADALPSAIDYEREARDRDHHRVARTDLHERLRGASVVPLRRDHELVWSPHAALRTAHVVDEPNASLALPRAEHDRRIERREDRQRVPGRRTGPEVAADRAGIADLGRPDRPRCLADRRRARIVVKHPRVGDERAHPHATVTFEVLELLDAIDRDDGGRPCPSEVDLDEKVGPARQNCRPANAGKVVKYIVNRPRDVDAHGRIITSVFERRSLGLPHSGGRRLGGAMDLERDLAASRAGEAAIGVLSLIRPDVRPFSQREIALVRAFADQAAIAIDNTRLSTATSDALERQIAVSQVLEAMSQSTADVSIVFRTIVRSVVHLCLADNASIFRADGEVYRHVASATASGRCADEAAFERIATEAARQGRLVKERATVVGRVLLEKATVQIPDVRADPDYDNTRGLDFIAALSGTPARTVLGVPIVKGAALVGIVIARRNEVSPFSPREIDVLETFARQAAVAVENVRLFNETKEALERQTATADILRAIAGSPTDLAPVLDAIATSVVRFCGATDAQVWIKRGDDLYPEAHYGDLPISNTPLAASADTVSGAAMLERRTIHIHDIESEAGDAFPLTRERFAALGQRAVLVAPLLREGSPIGTIALRKREPIPFTPNQIRLVEAFADQAVIAIENVRLFNETKEALGQQTATAEVLKTISRSVFDLERVLTTVVQNVATLCDADG